MATEIMKNLPSGKFDKKDKKEALYFFANEDINSITKNELRNAIIYLLDMADFDKKDWNGV